MAALRSNASDALLCGFAPRCGPCATHLPECRSLYRTAKVHLPARGGFAPPLEAGAEAAVWRGSPAPRSALRFAGEAPAGERTRSAVRRRRTVQSPVCAGRRQVCLLCAAPLRPAAADGRSEAEAADCRVRAAAPRFRLLDARAAAQGTHCLRGCCTHFGAYWWST